MAYPAALLLVVIMSTASALMASALAVSAAPRAAVRNVIHVIVDDLRPEIGAYGLPNRSTPVIDAIAAEGVVFDRAYAQQGVCGPSRNSFMSGRRPDRKKERASLLHSRSALSVCLCLSLSLSLSVSLCLSLSLSFCRSLPCSHAPNVCL